MLRSKKMFLYFNNQNLKVVLRMRFGFFYKEKNKKSN